MSAEPENPFSDDLKTQLDAANKRAEEAKYTCSLCGTYGGPLTTKHAPGNHECHPYWEGIKTALATARAELDAMREAAQVVANANKALLASTQPAEELEWVPSPGPDWTCAGCGCSGPFSTVKYDSPGEPIEYDIQCDGCESLDVRESAAEAAHVLGDQFDNCRADLAAARAEIGKLRSLLDRAFPVNGAGRVAAPPGPNHADFVAEVAAALAGTKEGKP